MYKLYFDKPMKTIFEHERTYGKKYDFANTLMNNFAHSDEKHAVLYLSNFYFIVL